MSRQENVGRRRGSGGSGRAPYRGQGQGRGNYQNQQEEAIQRPSRGRGTRPSGRRGPILGYKRLESLQTLSPEEIVNDLLYCKDSFIDLISSEEINDDWIVLLIHVLAKICKSLMKQNANELLSLLKESKFLSKNLKEYILGLQFEADDFSEEDLESLLQSLLTFFKEWLSRFQSSGQKLPLDEFHGCLGKLKCDVSGLQDEVDSLLEIRDQELRSRMEQKKLNKAFMKGRSTSTKLEFEGSPPSDFRELSVEPKSEEISSGEAPFLRRNRTEENEKYDDLNHYLDVQFRLLREDFVGPLREGIREIQRDVSKKERHYDLSLYEDVKIMGAGFTTSGVIRKIRFRPFVKRKDFWQHSKRLLFGSFLCLSKDKFKTMTFATVADRKPEDLAKGFIDVSFVNEMEPAANKEKFVMVESPAYFEAYRHVLQRVKEITSDKFPFQDYLVRCSPDVQRPSYLRDANVRYDLTEALSTAQGVNANVEVMNQHAWPSDDQVELNGSQYEALKAALTKEFVVIQGPPGTGKTYVGLKIVRALMDNRAVWNPDPEKTSCMLMVCHTNHALDQFLEGILSFQTDGVIRVGGRSKSDVLQKHNLHELTRLSEGQRRVYKETKQSQEYLENCVQVLNDSRKRILTLEELKGSIASLHEKQLICMTYEFKQKGLSPVEGWLGLKELSIPPQEQQNKMEHPVDEMIDEFTIDVDYVSDIIQSRRQIGSDANASKQVNVHGGSKRDGAQAKPQQYAVLNKQQLEILNGKKLQPMAQGNALSIYNIQRLDSAQRWSLYLFWLRLFRSNTQDEIKVKAENHEGQCKRLAEVKSYEELKVLYQAIVIGMTTTGAAKYSKLLEEIKPRIVVVEEAAEVLEAHIITSLTQETQHLILIGDHKQLRPNPTCYNLSQEYNLDVSLFERMVKGGMKCESLAIQHRMRPEISRILKHIYPKLDDHPKVLEYKSVPGVNHNIYFINHGVFEDNNDDDQKLKSYSNKHEATYMVALCEYFLNQGYRPEEITLLTMYTGQLIILRKLMPKERFQGVRVTAVDNFQGEENKIILLSLVRSNKERKIGFLGIENRVCVALSRAKEGFFCIGNFTMLAGKSELWKKIVEDMKTWGAIGSGLELVCRNHPETKVCAATVNDFDKVPEGGCLEPCAYRLNCGHSCQRVCHPEDSEHEHYKCRNDCWQELCSTHNTRCNQKCHYGRPCQGCKIEVMKVIPSCGHDVNVPCGVPAETFQCQEQCRTRFGCRHLCPKKCFEKCDPNGCKVQISKDLNCGHVATGDCSELRQSSFKCQKPCETVLECGHPCRGTCSSCKQERLHVTCKEPCQRILVCQHRCAEPCSKNCPPCTEKCENRCIHSRCPLKCHEPCTPCKEMCSWECQRSCRNRYKCTGLCNERCTRPRCDTPCFKKPLPCQHPCIGLCGEPCPKLCIVCNKEELTSLYFGGEDEKGARFIELLDCGHVFEIKGMDNWMSIVGDEDEDQSIQLKCCPKCKTPVRRSFRYADLVKEKLKDIERVKKKVLEEERNMEEEKEKLLDFIEELNEMYPEIGSQERTGYDDSEHGYGSDDEEEREEEEKEKQEEEEEESEPLLDIFKHWLEKRRTLTELTTIHNQMLLFQEICKLKRAAEEIFEQFPYEEEGFQIKEIQNELDFLQGKVVSTFHIQHQQLTDVKIEVTRVGLELKLTDLKCKITESMTLLNSTDQQTIERVEQNLTNGRRLKENDARDIDEALTGIGVRNGVPSLARQEWSLVPGMGFTTDHWCKCPKGHIHPLGQYRTECSAAAGE